MPACASRATGRNREPEVPHLSKNCVANPGYIAALTHPRSDTSSCTDIHVVLAGVLDALVVARCTSART